MNREESGASIDIPSILDPKSGERFAYARLSPAQDARERNVYTRTTAVVPVVFVPGIMGTNLRVRGGGAAAWRPPNGTIDGLASVAVWMWRGPKARQQRLNPASVEVDPDGPIDTGESGLSTKLARERGWGTVMKSSYHPILARMQQRLNRIAQFQSGAPASSPVPKVHLLPWWNLEGLRAPTEYGEQRGLSALTEEELIHAARYSYDVWCCGYNWLQSNRQSGADLKSYIENVVLEHYRARGVPAQKVIIVTHSMGGLVSRALTEIHNCDSVLGVVHGVQPATGAPAFYHHARCGYEGVEQVILGRNAGEVTSVIANAPGPLELAPSFDHDNGRPWLYFANSTGGEVAPPLPKVGDPYSEIYAADAWYGLVPAANTRYLDLSSSNDSGALVRRRAALQRLVGRVRTLHRELAANYFDLTYSHYGADSSRHSWNTILWKGDLSRIQRRDVFDDENGSYSTYPVEVPFRGDVVLTPSPLARLLPGPRKGGDGTVPESSGVAPGAAGSKASFRHGDMGVGDRNEQRGYDHQSSYKDARAEWATFYSVAKIAQAAHWPPERVAT